MPYTVTKIMNKISEKTTSPLLATINEFMALVKFLMFMVFIAYLFSGITEIKPDEIGIIMRMGKLVGNNPSEQIHKPGWIYALPKPFDTVIKIPDRKILQIKINELAANPRIKKDESGNISSIDPTQEGYCISGDENIYQTSITVKYQITDPIKLIFGYMYPLTMADSLIHDLTVSEMTTVSCKFTIDGLLTKDKKELSKQVQDQVQAKLNKINSGLSIISLEISEMVPPPFLMYDFEDVQTAFVDQHQFINRANSRKEVKLEEAKSIYEQSVNDAMAYKETVTAEANANANRFTQMLNAYEQNPIEVGSEMKSNTIKSIISKSGNLIVFPDVKESQGNVTLLLGMNGSVITKITTPEGYYEEDD